MKNKWNLLLCAMLAATMPFTVGGCGDSSDADAVAGTEQIVEVETMIVGEGETKFAFTVVDIDGNETVFEICTDKEIVGEALQELGLIDGEEGDYGLFVKEVNGITADYDTDGTYWAFYINDEYASTGVDVTTITEGDRYSFKVEK